MIPTMTSPIMDRTRPAIARPREVVDFIPNAENITPRISRTRLMNPSTGIHERKRRIRPISPTIKPVIAWPLRGSGAAYPALG
jgi:hypothetical protein